jgi:hypothetical protein
MKYPLLHSVAEQKVVMIRFLAHSLLLLSLPLFLNSCKKSTPDKPNTPVTPPTCDTCLPDITTTGKGTFGCKVNGKIWLPKGGWMSPATRLEYFQYNLMIDGENSENVNINVKEIHDTGYFDFSTFQFVSTRALFRNTDLTINYRSQPITNGYLHLLRFDMDKGIVSGTFAFDAYNTEGDSVHITEGRFDLRF